MLTSIAGHYFSYSPGEVVELDTQKAKKWIEAGIASPQKATRPPGEVAVKPSPKHVGGGYFELPDGRRVKGKEAAIEAMETR